MKIRILEICLQHGKLNRLPVVKGFSDGIGGSINKSDFFLRLNKEMYVNIWKMCITQWDGIFQKTNA